MIQKDGSVSWKTEVVEITDIKQKEEKRMKWNEDSLRNLWANIKHTNIGILGIPEGGERKGLGK